MERVGDARYYDLILWSVPLCSLQPAGNHQHRLDGPQSPIIVILLGQQLLTQRVQGDELPGQGLGLKESLRHEHDLADQPEIGDTHGTRPEENLCGNKEFDFEGFLP